MNKYAIGTILGAAAISGIKKVGSRSKRLHRNRYSEFVFEFEVGSDIDLKGRYIDLKDKRMKLKDALMHLDFVADVNVDQIPSIKVNSIHLDPTTYIEGNLSTYCEQISQVISDVGMRSLGLLDDYVLSLSDLEEEYEGLDDTFSFGITRRITEDRFKDNNYRIQYGIDLHGELIEELCCYIRDHQIFITGWETSEFWFYDEQGNKFMTSRDTTPKLRKR